MLLTLHALGEAHFDCRVCSMSRFSSVDTMVCGLMVVRGLL